MRHRRTLIVIAEALLRSAPPPPPPIFVGGGASAASRGFVGNSLLGRRGLLVECPSERGTEKEDWAAEGDHTDEAEFWEGCSEGGGQREKLAVSLAQVRPTICVSQRLARNRVGGPPNQYTLDLRKSRV